MMKARSVRFARFATRLLLSTTCLLLCPPDLRGQESSVGTRIVAESLSEFEQELYEGFAGRLDAYRQALKIPGMAAGIVKDHELVWAQGFGFADLEGEIPVTPQTTFHLASLTKTFASQIIMKLVEDGKVNLDDPVKAYGVRFRDDPGITVRHLLTHTSEDVPGRRYKYNGYRFSFLGKVVKEATGKSFRELVVAWILEPTGMRDTAPVLRRSELRNFRPDRVSQDIEENFKRVNKMLAKPYTLDETLEVVPGDSPDPDHFGVSTGLISNVLDMAKYDRAVDSHAFIKEETQALAFTPTVSNSRQTLPYGLGWFVQEFAGTKLLWHYGWEKNYAALILKVPQQHVTFVVFANTDYLSRPFSLGAGDVLNSPFAVEFLKTIALRDRFAEAAPIINWEAPAEQIAGQLGQAKGEQLKELLRREVIANLILQHHMDQSEQTRRLMDVYRIAFTTEAIQGFDDLSLVASIDKVGDDEYRTEEFTLDEDKVLRVYAIGEGVDHVMCDYGGIENAETGELVWEMYYIFTNHAGGAAKNRKMDRLVPLPAGTYRLHYRSDDSHSFDNWNNLPPDHYFWGIRLYDASETAGPIAGTFWEQAETPEALGWSSQKLEALRPELERLNSAALMVVTDGKVVFQWGQITNNIASHSTRKSLLSALYGIYVAEERIDPCATVEELGIEERIPLTEQERQARVIDLLKARSGVYIPAAAEVKSMRDARPKRGSHRPGTNWYYNNWDFNVLGTIFREQTGEDIYEAFGRRIAEPLGMQDYFSERQQYSYETNHSIHPAYPFLISARDMARLGQLFLQKGQWQGQQIIPAAWVEESTRSYSQTGNPNTGYGYMWWTVTDDHRGMKPGDYYASGYGGQKVFVLPRINTVVVHRVNIYLPGIDVNVTSAAPFRLMPKIAAAYTGQRAEVTPLVARGAVPERQLLPDYVAIQREVEARGILPAVAGPVTLARAWLLAIAVSLLALVVLLVWGPRPAWLSVVVWLGVAALFGPLALFAYHVSYRKPARSADPRAAAKGWRHALYATLHGATGYVVAVILVIVFFALCLPDADWAMILPVSYAAPLVFALLVFRGPFVTSSFGGGYWRAVRRSLLVEMISVNFVLVGMLPLFIFLRIRWFPGPLGPAEMQSAVFWLMMSLSVAAGALLLFASNVWLCRRDFSAVLPTPVAVPTAVGAGPGREPTLRSVWPLLVLSLVLVLGSVALTVMQISRASY